MSFIVVILVARGCRLHAGHVPLQERLIVFVRVGLAAGCIGTLFGRVDKGMLQQDFRRSEIAGGRQAYDSFDNRLTGGQPTRLAIHARGDELVEFFDNNGEQIL
jgi:hypothetical protein